MDPNVNQGDTLAAAVSLTRPGIPDCAPHLLPSV